MSLQLIDLINKRRRAEKLTTAEIKFITKAMVTKKMSVAQIGAFLDTFNDHEMSSTTELTDLTMALAYSGGIYDLSQLPGVKVACLSTGGLGDKTALVVLPLVASLGIPIFQMMAPLKQSTTLLKKLAAVPELKINLSANEFVTTLQQVGLVAATPVSELAPLQQQLTKLEVETGTATLSALMTSRLLSLPIAAGADALVLDIKTGNHGLNLNQARQLAQQVVTVGSEVGRRTLAVISDLNQPVGAAIGASWEIREVVETLQGHGPADLRELALSLGAQLALLGGYQGTAADARTQLTASLENGQALAKFKDWLTAQKANLDFISKPELLPAAPNKTMVRAPQTGYIAAWDMAQLAQLQQQLGSTAGVGFILDKKIGAPVKAGENLMTIYSDQTDAQAAAKLAQQAPVIAAEAPETHLLYDVIDSNDVPTAE
ncbi:pyrimidine-nucleoside phosphorylase [Loigolactobacillus rennini]|uniref:Pyrimidine-nucleoside phosphorylase n=2 Tax=Loigolactobacillus rennini TaxID=238013 RepID=A0A0R2DA20_9LACO|nr:pyrimidine-nucleoside phosphorylase [Loigolactobacillus rennini]KRM97212.1 pyrimidine-nucleoside phosphorylase [Loigolactobacillus rennini DSM 20253]SFZ88530.1 Pyrimidine-nucleoside phosphorylase [Loigolactobacillus rennini]